MRFTLAALMICPFLAATAGAGEFKVYEHGVPQPVTGRVLTFSGMDTNRNGLLEPYEIKVAFGANARDAIMAFDGDGDGHLTRQELRHFGDNRTGGPDGVLIEYARG